MYNINKSNVVKAYGKTITQKLKAPIQLKMLKQKLR